MDSEVTELCDAINKIPGLRTYDSCCGHDKGEFYVSIKSTSIQALYPLCNALRWIDLEDGKNLISKWIVQIQATDVPYKEDDPNRPMKILFHTNNITGEEAYKQSKLIASYLNQSMEKEMKK